MSTHKVAITRIDQVERHPNADRLDLVRVGGWVCVTGRDTFKVGDYCLYIPIDSVLSADTELRLFPADSKIKLSKSRVKTCKIRGVVSQGMVVHLSVFADILPPYQHWEDHEGEDYAEDLGITKYAPPVKACSHQPRTARRKESPYFKKYTDLENIKNHMNTFAPGDNVVVTEKIHGTNFRAGWVPFTARTLWQKFLKLIGRAPEWEFVYGSRNQQLTSASKTYYDNNLYAEAVRKYNLREKIPFGFVLYGEIYGDGVQPGYNYGCAKGEHKLVVFEVMSKGKFDDPVIAELFCASLHLPFVPVLYSGGYDYELIKAMAKGPSVLAPLQSVREGVVVRSYFENTDLSGRKIRKFINDDYLLSKHADEEVAQDMVVA